MQQIYLDYNATTPVDPEVFDAMRPFFTEHFGNPSSSYSLGSVCREAIEDARNRIAALLGSQSDEIYFTGGGTESNNIAIKGTLLQAEKQQGHLVTSCFEHPAVSEPARFHSENGGTVSRVGCDTNGMIDADSIKKELKEETRLVSIMHANNEIGTVQPIREISELCRDQEVVFHTDAAQSVGKVRVKVDELGVDLLTLAGHKIYGPKGIGVLYIRHGTEITPPVHGANHERGIRPGTENVPYIVGLGVAAKKCSEHLVDSERKLRSFRDQLESILMREIQGLMINGGNAPRLPNTTSIIFPDVNAGNLLKRLPELCVSTGAACHSHTVELSDTLKGIGLTAVQGSGTLRISCGRMTQEKEITTAANLLISAWESTRE